MRRLVICPLRSRLLRTLIKKLLLHTPSSAILPHIFAKPDVLIPYGQQQIENPARAPFDGIRYFADFNCHPGACHSGTQIQVRPAWGGRVAEASPCRGHESSPSSAPSLSKREDPLEPAPRQAGREPEDPGGSGRKNSRPHPMKGLLFGGSTENHLKG